MNVLFLSLFRSFISHHQSSINPDDRCKDATIRIYTNKYCLLNDFLIDNSIVKISAFNFDKKVARQYYEWLRAKQYSKNYSIRCVELCRQILEYGASEDILPGNPLNYLRLKRDPPQKPPYFTKEQMARFLNYETDDLNMRKVCDMALLQMNTGFEYGDLGQITKDHVKSYQVKKKNKIKTIKVLVKGRYKNGNEAVIPFNPIIESILEKYDYKMQMFTNAGYNKLLKKLAMELEIEEKLTGRALRKIFLMDKLNNELIPLAPVSKMAGHKRITTTEKYYVETRIEMVLDAIF